MRVRLEPNIIFWAPRAKVRDQHVVFDNGVSRRWEPKCWDVADTAVGACCFWGSRHGINWQTVSIENGFKTLCSCKVIWNCTIFVSEHRGRDLTSVAP